MGYFEFGIVGLICIEFWFLGWPVFGFLRCLCMFGDRFDELLSL